MSLLGEASLILDASADLDVNKLVDNVSRDMLNFIDTYRYDNITVTQESAINDFENLVVSGFTESVARKTIPEIKVDALSMITEVKFNIVSTLMNSTSHVLKNSVAGTGVGLDGVYVANNATNYLQSVTSLKGADEELDSQLKATTDRVNTAINAAGLNSANGGVYEANNATNYLQSVTSLKGADEALDSQLKATTDRVDQLISTTSEDTLTALQSVVVAFDGLNDQGSNLVLGAVGALAKEHREEIVNITTVLGIDVSADATGNIVNDFSVSWEGALNTWNTASFKDAIFNLDNHLGNISLLHGPEATNLTTISNTTSIVGALIAIDNAIQGAVGGDLDAIKTNVGLEGDGSLTISGDYIENAANLKNAVELLDDRARLFEDKLIHLHNALYADPMYTPNLSTEQNYMSVIENTSVFWMNGPFGTPFGVPYGS